MAITQRQKMTFGGSVTGLSSARFAWITRWRRLCRDHEGLPQSSEAFITLSASARMLTRLAPAFPWRMAIKQTLRRGMGLSMRTCSMVSRQVLSFVEQTG
jgi:hypothetical protein